MAIINKKNNNKTDKNYASLLQQLKQQLADLTARCTQLDNSIEQTENHCFVFEVHIFNKRCLSLSGYSKQMQYTFASLQKTITHFQDETLIKIECELFIKQYQLLLQLVQGLERGEAKQLYKSYSEPKEKIYQQLQKQYQYESRLLNMIAEQEELLQNDKKSNARTKHSYIKEKIEALKIRYQKCNRFTQKLEFQLEDLQDE